MQLGYTYTSRDLLRHSVSARRGMRLRIFDARRARSEHAREFGPDDDPSPRARFPVGARRGDPFSTMRQPFAEVRLVERRPRGLHRAGANGRRPSREGPKRAFEKGKNVRLKTRTTGETETDGRMNGDLNRGPRIRHPAFLDATSVVG